MIKTLNCLVVVGILALAGCGGDDDGTEADRLGVGAECIGVDEPCDEETEQVCLTQFKGGYCGLSGCESDEDCPDGSGCVLHEDQETYCFRVCLDKIECNDNRSLENESNCSSNVEFVEDVESRKACVPPSG